MEPLKDPKNDRVLKNVRPPPSKPLDTNIIWADSTDGCKIIRLSKLGSSLKTFKEVRKSF